MRAFLKTGYAALLTIFLGCSTSHAGAEQPVEVDVVTDAETGQETIRATSAFGQHGHALQKVLRSVSDYAGLHPWISDTRLIKDNGQGEAEVLIEFSLPWPIGCRWSHIRVQHDSDGSISWQQLSGNIEANEGRLVFTEHGDQGITVEYSAIIDLGLPKIFMRSFKKQFVVEFVNAAYARAEKQSESELALATPADYNSIQIPD